MQCVYGQDIVSLLAALVNFVQLLRTSNNDIRIANQVYVFLYEATWPNLPAVAIRYLKQSHY